MAKQVVYAQKTDGERIPRDEALSPDLQAVLDRRYAESVAHAAGLAAMSDQYFQDPKRFPENELGGTA